MKNKKQEKQENISEKDYVYRTTPFCWGDSQAPTEVNYQVTDMPTRDQHLFELFWGGPCSWYSSNNQENMQKLELFYLEPEHSENIQKQPVKVIQPEKDALGPIYLEYGDDERPKIHVGYIWIHVQTRIKNPPVSSKRS